MSVIMSVNYTGNSYDKALDRDVHQGLTFQSYVGDYLTTEDEIKTIGKVGKQFFAHPATARLNLYAFLRQGANVQEQHLWTAMVELSRWNDNNEPIYILTLQYEHETTATEEGDNWKELLKHAVCDCLRRA